MLFLFILLLLLFSFVSLYHRLFFTCMSCGGAIVCLSNKVTASTDLVDDVGTLVVIDGDVKRMLFAVRIGLLSFDDESRLR